MTVAVTPVQNDAAGRNMQILAAALNAATSIYGVKMNEKQQEAANKLTAEKTAQEQQQKKDELATKNTEARKDWMRVGPDYKGDGAVSMTLPGDAAPALYLPTSVYNKKMETDADIKKAQIAAASSSAKSEKEKQPDLNQSNAALFGKRIESANSILASMENKEGFDPTDPMTNVQGSSYYPEFWKSEDYKLYQQAKRNFVNAALRRESGANISPREFDEADQQYFPASGDTTDVLAQKRQNRDQVLEGLKVGAGNAWDKIKTVEIPPPKKEGGSGQATAAPLKQDPQISSYAQKNGLDYSKARAVLINRGYKPNE